MNLSSPCRFCTDAGRYALECVLRAYAALDPEVGYCQGMNFLAGLLLCWLPSPADAFGALVVVMQERGLRELYKRDLAMLQVYPLRAFNFMPGAFCTIFYSLRISLGPEFLLCRSVGCKSCTSGTWLCCRYMVHYILGEYPISCLGPFVPFPEPCRSDQGPGGRHAGAAEILG